MLAAFLAAMMLAPRYLPRLTATIGLFTRYGLADFARQQGLRGLADGDDDREADASEELAVAFRRRLVELGPAYVKLGQVLSTRPDLLPQTYIRELEQLQDDVAPIPFADVELSIETELGGRISKLFASFDHEPLGSASLGQVHAATLRDGREVVVKVQRPDIRAQLADDIAFFDQLATFLAEHTEAGARVDMIGIVQQLERALADELDYRVEARNAAAFRRRLAEYRRIVVPRVIDGYSTERVLTTERVRGVKVSEVSPLTRLEHDFTPIADELTRAYLKQIVIDGFFHADPHPGNLFIVLPSHAPSPPDPDDEVDVRLALIDFGMTARLPATLREQMVRLLLDVADDRGDDAAEALVELGQLLPSFDRDAYVREVASLVARNYELTVGDVHMGGVLYELINISYQRGLRLPAELTLLAKAMFNLDAVTRALDPGYSPLATIRDFGNDVAADRARRALSPHRLLQLATEGTSLVTALPHRLDLITQRLATNDFATRVDVPQATLLMEALQKVANRVFSGVVLAGLLVASAMLLPYQRSLGTAGFVLAGALGLWMVLSILWSDRKRD